MCGPRDSRYLPPFRHDEFCRALAGLNARGIPYIVSYDGRTGAKAFGEPLPAAAPAPGSVCRTVHAGHAAGPHRCDLRIPVCRRRSGPASPRAGMADRELPPHFPVRLQAVTVKRVRTIGHACMPLVNRGILIQACPSTSVKGDAGFRNG